jgi:hypothetical protein
VWTREWTNKAEEVVNVLEQRGQEYGRELVWRRVCWWRISWVEKDLEQVGHYTGESQRRWNKIKVMSGKRVLTRGDAGVAGFRRSGGREGYIEIKSLGMGICNRRYGDMKGVP